MAADSCLCVCFFLHNYQNCHIVYHGLLHLNTCQCLLSLLRKVISYFYFSYAEHTFAVKLSFVAKLVE